MSLFPGESKVAILWTTYNEKRGKMLASLFVFGEQYIQHMQDLNALLGSSTGSMRRPPL